MAAPYFSRVGTESRLFFPALDPMLSIAVGSQGRALCDTGPKCKVRSDPDSDDCGQDNACGETRRSGRNDQEATYACYRCMLFLFLADTGRGKPPGGKRRSSSDPVRAEPRPGGLAGVRGTSGAESTDGQLRRDGERPV